MIVVFEVGVALRRPPRLDEVRKIAVEADTEHEAWVLACSIAECTCVMVVQTTITEILEI